MHALHAWTDPSVHAPPYAPNELQIHVSVHAVVIGQRSCATGSEIEERGEVLRGVRNCATIGARKLPASFFPSGSYAKRDCV